MDIPSFLQTSRVIEETSSPRYAEQGKSTRLDNSYIITSLDRHYKGNPFQLIVSYNILDMTRILKNCTLSGLIIPHGHGDINTLGHLDLKHESLPFPVFEGFKYGLIEVESEFKKWLSKNFRLK